MRATASTSTRIRLRRFVQPQLPATDVKLADGRIDPAFGWVATDYIGIDQGPILAMIGNYRNELVWDAMRDCTPLRRGLQRAGSSGGWLASAA